MMKKGILLLLLFSSVFAEAQSLKEALFRGKLKNTPGTVIRKGDDLSTKMDTTTKTAPDTTAKAALPTLDSAAQTLTARPDSAALTDVTSKDSSSGITDTAVAAAAVAAPVAAAPAPKDNNALWKDHVNTVSNTLNSEVLTSKKIKKGTYYATVSYTIETDGQVSVNDVFLSPENDFLQQQIKDRLNLDTPRLNPVLSSSGQPRKVTRKYNFKLTKE